MNDMSRHLIKSASDFKYLFVFLQILQSICMNMRPIELGSLMQSLSNWFMAKILSSFPLYLIWMSSSSSEIFWIKTLIITLWCLFHLLKCHISFHIRHPHIPVIARAACLVIPNLKDRNHIWEHAAHRYKNRVKELFER